MVLVAWPLPETFDETVAYPGDNNAQSEQPTLDDCDARIHELTPHGWQRFKAACFASVLNQYRDAVIGRTIGHLLDKSQLPRI